MQQITQEKVAEIYEALSDAKIQMDQKHAYLEALYDLLHEMHDKPPHNNLKLQVDVAGNMFYWNDRYQIHVNIGLTQYLGNADFPTDSNVGLDVCIIDDDGEGVHQHTEPFFLSFDMRQDSIAYLGRVRALQQLTFNAT